MRIIELLYMAESNLENLLSLVFLLWPRRADGHYGYAAGRWGELGGWLRV